MKNKLLALALVVIPGFAQNVPQYLLFGGGTYFRMHASGAEDSRIAGVPDFALQQRNLNFDLVGWNAQVTENMNTWFGMDLDFSGGYGSPSPTFLCSASSLSNASACLSSRPVYAPVTTKIHTYTFGPRISFRGNSRLRPYVHVLLGAANIHGSLNHSAIFTPIPTLLPQGYSSGDTAFAVAPGAGADLSLSERFGIRLFEIDYFMTRFYGQRQDNARVSVGLNFQFGSR